jgi:hypothetical protein
MAHGPNPCRDGAEDAQSSVPSFSGFGCSRPVARCLEADGAYPARLHDYGMMER